jgi:hypothetical protein
MRRGLWYFLSAQKVHIKNTVQFAVTNKGKQLWRLKSENPQPYYTFVLFYI